METAGLLYQPIEGKTYSLFGNSNGTVEYYKLIKSLSDTILTGIDLNKVLATIKEFSQKKRYLSKLTSRPKENELISFILSTINNDLKQFTKATSDHLKNLPISKIWDRRLATTEEQYHLYMLEIELTNRLNKDSFLKSNMKISLQPYCLQDFSVECKAKSNEFDYQCRSCSKKCFQNHASKKLKENNIEPYIWMGASISKAAKEAYKNNQTFGILGIACIPELVWGMRKCSRYKIPVVGIPLNANRCVRWFGEFQQNSIDISELERLLKV